MRRLALGLLAAASAAMALHSLSAEEPEEGRRYALIVGVQNYEGTALGSLRYCDNDAAGLAEVLGKRGYHVTLMTRPEYKAKDRDELLPTADNIRDNLKAILLNRKRADTVLIAFSGHGEQLKKDGKMYFCAAKCNLDKPATLVALDEVYALLKDNPAGGKVLIVDACRNDPLAGKAVASEKLESVTRPELPEPPASTVALFSCAKGQVAYESDALKHGYLFYFVIDGLEGKAANKKDGRITWLGLAKHVDDELPDAVRAEMGSKAMQTPEMRGESLALVLAHVDAGSALPDATTPEVSPEDKKDEITYEMDDLEKNFGVKFKAAKLEKKKTGGAQITMTLEFTKDLAPADLLLVRTLFAGKPGTRGGGFGPGMTSSLQCYFFDEDGVVFSQQPPGKIAGAVSGKDGDAFRITQIAPGDVLAKTKKISFREEPYKK